ncbi:MAG: anthranilate synthase component I [Candidatus Omnitrophica bacterium]|nr:anthranilate synthase component I [Candidatus Omnitrophota bacterium]MCM8793818.1 anthranilate synthase component I [Candidatus Omnitrophota bacterium]
MYYPTKQEFLKLAKKGNLIPVYREMLADLETPVSAFMKLNTEDYACLLESVEGEENVARYSFLTTGADLIFKSKGKKVEIIKQGGKINFETENPLIEIKKILTNFHYVPLKELPRFSGGFVGYIGYDTVRFFEEIPHHRKDDLNLPESFFLLAESIVIFDHLKHRIKIVVNAYIEDSKKIETIYAQTIEKIEKIFKKLRTPLREKKISKSVKGKRLLKFSSNFTKQDFMEAVDKIKEYIRRGEIIQAVLSQRFVTKIRADGFDIYRALRSINPSPYMYYLKLKDFFIVGASPEVFVRCEEGKVELRPIAGTRRRGENEEEDKLLEEELLNSEKERAEHIMLVDLGRNDLGRVCEYASVKVTELMVIERYSHVMHIVSNITGKLRRDKDIFDLIKATFPAGTVTGAPKIRAMEIIAELEHHCRGPYAGCVGYFSFSGNLDSCITIRTIIIKDNQAYIQAGAGIVADSEPRLEYQETVNKAKAMLKAIALAEQGLT